MSWYYYALAAATAIIIRDLAHKKALHYEHTLEMLVTRGLFLIPLLLCLSFFIDISLPLGTLPLIYGVSLLMTAGILLRVRGLRHLDVGKAAPLQNLNPLFLLLIAGIFLGEMPTPVQLIGILLILAGTYYIEGSKEFTGFLGPIKHLKHDKYAWLIIAAALFLSMSQTADKFLIGKGIDVFTYLFWIWLFINLNFIMIHLARFRWQGLKTDLVRDWRWLGIAAVALFAQMLFYYKAISIGPVTLVLPINRLSALGLVIIGGGMLHEGHLRRRLISGALMIAGALLVIL
jgi:drug/metabolite transporter (DMT)-like permease